MIESVGLVRIFHNAEILVLAKITLFVCSITPLKKKNAWACHLFLKNVALLKK